MIIIGKHKDLLGSLQRFSRFVELWGFLKGFLGLGAETLETLMKAEEYHNPGKPSSQAKKPRK